MRLLVWKTYSARLSCRGSGTNGRTVGGRPVTDPLTGHPALHTGTLQADGIGNHSDRPTITITTPDPFPATILALQYDLLPTGQ
jgi:hypothetical protein